MSRLLPNSVEIPNRGIYNCFYKVPEAIRVRTTLFNAEDQLAGTFPGGSVDGVINSVFYFGYYLIPLSALLFDNLAIQGAIILDALSLSIGLG